MFYTLAHQKLFIFNYLIMSEAKNGSKVKVHYTGKLNDGSVFDSSVNREPLAFTVGAGEMIKGFDTGVLGMKAGDKKTVTLSPDEAYGQPREDMVIKVAKENIPEDIKPQVGMNLSMNTQDGRQVPVVVSDVSDAEITLDANHPLAGKELTFEIEMVEVA